MKTIQANSLIRFLIALPLFLMICPDTSSGACQPVSSFEQSPGSNQYLLTSDRLGNNPDCFDEIMRAIPEGARIELGPGRFLTRGAWNIYAPVSSIGFNVKTGWRLYGQGVGKTVLTMAVAPPEGMNYILASPRGWAMSPTSNYQYQMREGTTLIRTRKDYLVHDVHIHSMTLDCVGANIAKSAPVKADRSNDLTLGGVYLFGNNITVENIQVINSVSRMMIGGKSAKELFTVYVSGHPANEPDRDSQGFPSNPAQLANVQIRNVVIDQYQGGYCSGITVTGETGGVVENCRVILRGDTPEKLGNGGAQFGLNLSGRGTYGVTFRNNYIENAARGLNNDTGPNAMVSIIGNEFNNCGVGIALTALCGGSRHEAVRNDQGQVVRSIVENNTIRLSPRPNQASQRAGIAINPRIETLPDFNHRWSGAYGITVKNNTIYNAENKTGLENWGIVLGVVPSSQPGNEFWSYDNIVEGNKLYDNEDGQPLFNVIANVPDQKDSNQQMVFNTIARQDPNVRMSKKGFIFKSWKNNGTAPVSAEFPASRILNSFRGAAAK